MWGLLPLLIQLGEEGWRGNVLKALSLACKSWVGFSASLLDNTADVVRVFQLPIEKAEGIRKETEAGCLRS